ncbi:MAG: DUF4279 domain-containing protein [Clostridium sp.]|nr:DUF4279 domain-containing protein [Ruminococcus flavefaciens]MCM1500434.1 DUF4279 domain-containing protein [Clostridium sp.]
MNNTNVRVELRIMGDEFDVSAISKELGVAPTETWNNGDYIRNTKRKRSYTAWIFSTGAEETLDINTQLKKIEAVFFPKEATLCRLKEQYNLEFSIDIVIVIENQSPPAIYLDSPMIHFASHIGAGFDMDTYVN